MTDPDRVLGFRVRAWGDPASPHPLVLALHGGPGAPGTMAPVARELAGGFRVLEPFQRRASGDAPLTTARHVADLAGLIALRAAGEPVTLVGSSHGAMLALACAAAHPAAVGRLVLVGCGTYDEAARARFRATVEERLDAATRARLARLDAEVPDPDLRLRRRGELLLPAFSHDLLTTDLELERCDARGHEETWADELRLQAAGVHPRAFAAIRAPVLLVHGREDPHPGEAVREALAPHLRRLELVELAACGHYPWLERAAREPFLALLREHLARG